MRSYMNLVVLALTASTVSPTLSAPIQYRYGNLHVELKDRAFLMVGIPLVYSDPAVDVFRRVEFPRSESGIPTLPSTFSPTLVTLPLVLPLLP